MLAVQRNCPHPKPHPSNSNNASITKHQRKGDLPSYLNIGIISSLKVPIDGCHSDAVMLVRRVPVVRPLHRTLYLAAKVSFYQPVSCLDTQGRYLTLYSLSLQHWKVSGAFHGAFYYLNLKGAVLGADSSAVRAPTNEFAPTGTPLRSRFGCPRFGFSVIHYRVASAHHHFSHPGMMPHSNASVL